MYFQLVSYSIKPNGDAENGLYYKYSMDMSISFLFEIIVLFLIQLLAF